MGRRVTQSMACVIQYSSAGSAPSTSQTVYIRYQIFPVGIVTVTGSGRRRVGGPLPQTSWVVDVQQCPGRARSQWRDARCARPGGDVHDRNAPVGGPDRRKIISVRGIIIRADMADRVPSAAVRGTCQTGAVARFDFRHHNANHLINLTHRPGRALKTRLCDMTPAAEGDLLTSACSIEGMRGRLAHRNLPRTGLPETAR
jgi:hypothetical protein